MVAQVSSVDVMVDVILDRIIGDIVLGAPLGIGKPNTLINALYRRIRANPARRLKIITALSLEKPVGHSDIEKHFLAPFVERVFGDYPDLDYVKDLRAGTLPPNIEVLEFFLKTGDYLGNDVAQQGYISTNYTFVARDMALHGVNVICQSVASKEIAGERRLSLSSNTDVTFEAIEHLQAMVGHPFISVAVVNNHMPFMPNKAEVSESLFDYVVTDPNANYHLFSPPNMKVTTPDYAIGLHAASLVVDGGTLQIGIGALGDAIAQALILREQRNEDFHHILDEINHDGVPRERGRFEAGLYGCSEMFVNGFLRLIEAGIVRREVFNDLALQHLLNKGLISTTIDHHTLASLLAAGRIHSPLTADDVAFLTRFGVLKAGVQWQENSLLFEGASYANDIADIDALAMINQALLGKRLLGGIHMHGGFFLGPEDFYQRLRVMPASQLDHIEMHRIDFINQLDGHGALAHEQRRKARFMNTTMMVTLLGAAVSDGLETGQVVSGVGGQYNFVAMGHALPDARSVLMLRATRETRDGVTSNIVWNYGHTTIPRHLRDMVITEYGVADLRGQSDAEVVKRLLAITDSRFQEGLAATAKANGKLEASYEIPEAYRQNLPATLQATLAPWHDAGLLPDFPFGTDFTEDELAMVRVLQRLKHAADHPLELISSALKGLFEQKEVPPAWLERLGLDDAHGMKNLLVRRLFIGNI